MSAPSQIEPLYTDAEVARMLDPGGTRIKARSIRSEREAGRLVGTKIAGKWLYRGSDVAAFLDSAREVSCRAQTQAPALSSATTNAGPVQSGSSAGPTTGGSSKGQRVAMPRILGQLSNSSKAGFTSAEERNEPAQVIPIRS